MEEETIVMVFAYIGGFAVGWKIGDLLMYFFKKLFS